MCHTTFKQIPQYTWQLSILTFSVFYQKTESIIVSIYGGNTPQAYNLLEAMYILTPPPSIYASVQFWTVLRIVTPFLIVNSGL